jgi:hypothetical protein
MKDIVNSTRRPLSYLRTQGRADLRSAFELYEKLRASPEVTIRELRGVTAHQQTQNSDDIDTLLRSQESNLRLAGVALVIARRRQTRDLCRCIAHLVFEDSAAEVRGLALISLFVTSTDQSIASLARDALSESLSQSFGIHSSVIGQVSQAWLETLRTLMLEMMVGSQKKRTIEAWMRELAGTNLPKMMSDRSFAESLLQSTDVNTRKAALLVLSDHWGATKALTTQFRTISETDPEIGARILAIRKLATANKKSRDKAIAVMLGRVVQDSTLPNELREIAYEALFEVVDAPVDTWPEMRRLASSFSFPSDVDWQWIDSILCGDTEVEKEVRRKE